MSTPSGPSPAAQPPRDATRPTAPVDPAGLDGGVPPTEPHKRPWGWIAAVVVLVIVAGGLALWAIGLNADLDDQKDQTAQAQQSSAQAQQESAQAKEQAEQA